MVASAFVAPRLITRSRSLPVVLGCTAIIVPVVRGVAGTLSAGVSSYVRAPVEMPIGSRANTNLFKDCVSISIDMSVEGIQFIKILPTE